MQRSIYDSSKDLSPKSVRFTTERKYESRSLISGFKLYQGLKLVAFFIAAQHVFVAFYEGDPDSAIHIGELRDKFFDETSYWCLPKKVLENCAYADQSTSVGL